MRMNISVPDALAEEVRRRGVPISAVCQQALRDEVTRLRELALDRLEADDATQAVMDAAERNGCPIGRDTAVQIAAAVLSGGFGVNSA